MAGVAPRVELYGAGGCPYTAELREHLTWSRVVFVEYDVEEDLEACTRLAALTEGQRMVPVLVEDGRVTQVGWRGRSCMVDAPSHGRRP